MSSALYVGRVVHLRKRPRQHRLSYACYWLLVDLDEIEKLDRALRLFSHNRFNMFSLHDRDYGAGDGASMRDCIEIELRRAGIDIADAKISLLTMPCVLGYTFNPLSVYFCHRRDGELAALVYEVHNTFGQRHSYLIAASPQSDCSGDVLQTASKQFYVSPFLDMDLSYDFRVSPPGEDVRVTIRASNSDGPLLNASLAGTRQPLSDGALLKVFVTHPLLSLKVIAAIHWEALRLWWKGVKLVPRPDPPDSAVTIVSHSPRIRTSP